MNTKITNNKQPNSIYRKLARRWKKQGYSIKVRSFPLLINAVRVHRKNINL